MTTLRSQPAQVVLEVDPGQLNFLVQAASGARGLDELLSLLLPQLNVMLPCNGVGFFWHEPAGIILRVVASSGREAGVEHVQIPVHPDNLSWSRRASYSHENASSGNPVLRWLGLYGLRSAIFVPVVVGREPQGTLLVGRGAPRAFHQGELRALAEVARLLGPALGYTAIRERLLAVEKELATVRDELTQSERFKLQVELAHGVAHDVNNILGLIAVRADMLRLQPLPPTVMAAVQAIQDAVEDGVAGIRRITQVAQEQRNQRLTPVAVDRLLAEALEMTRPRWQDPNVCGDRSIRVRLEPGSGSVVMGLAPELREVIVNMILNAVRALKDGGELVLSSTRDGPWAVLSVSDTGCGMSEEVRRRVFEPFFSTETETGRGLGLWVSQGIVRRHGGEITVESRPGKGTVFRIRLPLAAERPVGAAPEARTSRGSILVVDDEIGLAEALRFGLEAGGYQVAASGDAREALRMYQSLHYDLVITDIRMPGMSGWELAAEIKRIDPSTRVVAMTGWPVHLISEGERANYFDVILQKPCKVRDVEALVGRLLGKSGADA